MNLLSVENLSKSFGDKELFRKLSFGIQRGERIALIAKNGSGKTTLLNILKGKEIADEGNVVFRNDCRVAFLDQEQEFQEEQTIAELLSKSQDTKTKLINEYNFISNQLESQPEKVDHDRYQFVLEQMEVLKLWDYEIKVKTILSKLKIHDLEQKISELSGGQKKRLALIEVILKEPDLIILDEPTNHLDIEMIEWLEHYLINADLSALIITHDRYFLDQVCNRIIEIDQKQLFYYQGDFEYYLEKKAERIQNEQSELEKNKNTFRRELEWVRKMPKARGTKSKSRLNAFAELEEKLKNKRIEEKIEISVKMERMGSKIIELSYLNKSYGEKTLIKDFNYTFKTGEKIGIVGKNGAGKTTLLNILLGTEDPNSGSVVKGETVKFGYYSQKGISLKEDQRVIEVIKDIAEFIPMADGSKLSASSLLNKFNFKPEVQHNFVSKLSGGEKRRLYLLTVLTKNPNFLILDEPTNDLDITTLETLEEFLINFKGCVLVVSHDRYFLDKICDHLFCFEGEGLIKDFPGNYTEYRVWQELNQKQKKEALADNNTSSKTKKKSEGKNKLSYKEQKELEDLENEISTIEEKKKRLENTLIESTSDTEKILNTSNEISILMNELESKTLRWMELQEKFENQN